MPSLLTKLKLEAKYLSQQGTYVIGPFTIFFLFISFFSIMFLAMDPTANQIQLLLYIVMLLGACVLVLFEHEQGYAKIQMHIGKLNSQSLFGAAVSFIALIITQVVFSPVLMQGSVWTKNLLVWLAPSPEEILFRVALLGWFIAQGGILWISLGVMVQATIFAVFHYMVYTVTVPGYFLFLLFGGINFGLTYLLWKDSDANTLSHFGNNFLASLAR